MSELAAAIRVRAGRPDWGVLAQAVGAAGLAGGLGAANGGYFPTSWGWTALALAWVGVAVIVIQGRIALARLELALLASVAALTAWTWLSTIWSTGTERSFLDSERTLVVFAAVAVVLIVRRLSFVALLAGLATGMTVTAAYGLTTRLFPERFGLQNDPIGGYRLARPLGYYNSLGLYCAIAAIIALVLALRAQSVLGRALAAASLTILLPALYFTFSRGAWLSLAFGVLVLVAFDPRRLQLVAGLPVAVPAVVAVLLGRHASALTHEHPALSAASAAGHRLALEVIFLAALALAFSIAHTQAERRVPISPRMRRAFAGTLAFGAIAVLIAVFVHYGSPTTIASRGYKAFNSAPPAATANLNARFSSFSGNRRSVLWHAAWTDTKAHPVLGSGAGTFDIWWYAHRRIDYRTAEAHSLYLETLAELGPFGLLFLLSLLAVPLVACLQARRQPLVVGALGAYAAFLLHAAGDWDWEVPAITVPALVLGAACVRAASSHTVPRLEIGRRGRVAAAAVLVSVAGFAFVTLVGNGALAKSTNALKAGDVVQAHRQATRALDWMPWSAQAWERLGETQVETHQFAAARVSFRHAVAQEPHDWLPWYELEGVTRGAERQHAARQVIRLNPRSQEATLLRRQIARGRL